MFGYRLRKVRVSRGLTQAYVAKLLPMNQSNYSKIERGVQEPSLIQMFVLCRILQVSADYLLGIDIVAVTKERQQLFFEQLEKTIRAFYIKMGEDVPEIDEDKPWPEPDPTFE